MYVFVNIHVSVCVFSVPERHSLRKALYKLLLHLFCSVLPCTHLSFTAFPEAVLRLCCQAHDVIAGAVESLGGRQGRSFTENIFLHAQEDLFCVAFWPWVQMV